VAHHSLVGGVVDVEAADETDYEVSCPYDQPSIAHVLLEGKVYHGAILAAAAYDSPDKHRQVTGLDAVFVEDKATDTQVGAGLRWRAERSKRCAVA